MLGYSNLGSSLMLSGNLTDAAAAFQRSIEIEPGRSAYTNLGLVYYYLGKRDQAVSVLQNAVDLAPNDHLAWSGLGDALSFTEDTEAATAAFRTAEQLAENHLAVNPMQAEVLIDLAWIRAMLGKLPDARESIARAQELTPGDPHVYLYSAMIAVRAKEFSSAYEDLRKAIELGYPPEMVAVEPHLKSINGDPRFVALVKASEVP
jgi:Flp pilus assembly protein TadD